MNPITGIAVGHPSGPCSSSAGALLAVALGTAAELPSRLRVICRRRAPLPKIERKLGRCHNGERRTGTAGALMLACGRRSYLATSMLCLYKPARTNLPAETGSRNGVPRPNSAHGDRVVDLRNAAVTARIKITTPHEGQIAALILSLILSLSPGITSDGHGPRCGLWGTSISCLHDQVLAKSMTAMPPDGPASPRKLRQNRLNS